MKRNTPRVIVIENRNHTPMGIQIEPWAMYERIAPGSRAEFAFENDLDRTLEFTITERGDAFIGIDDDITFSIDGQVVFSSRQDDRR
ncbi:hypothetical protein [Bradyrhizobium sp. SZCCHNS3002]|uniref:hypothetical protein n=1 Tax=Bradyrhizobium sp. SZCCHNS3002 TaxID=3057310 RepID=UPI0028E8253B|nr:hypothetical protein [Bradyrhizobium sp. SZCCHNS3002]